MREGVTIRDAAYEWVREMNAIQQNIILKLMRNDPDEWTEVTVPATGDRVYVYNTPDGCDENYGTIEEYNEDDDVYIIELDDDTSVRVELSEFEVERDDKLPMWGTMWSFGDSADDWWLEDDEGIKLMSECGFRIYEHEEFGYFFGIDGCGYDFYEAHWIPLYKARGLQWHDPATEKEQEEIQDE